MYVCVYLGFHECDCKCLSIRLCAVSRSMHVCVCVSSFVGMCMCCYMCHVERFICICVSAYICL